MPTLGLRSRPVKEFVADAVARELSQIIDTALLTRMRPLLVSPYPVECGWDYESTGESCTCWTVLEHPQSNTGIANCRQGFGPADPWGLVLLSGPFMRISMDSAWIAIIEDALRASPAWDLLNPPGYEVV